MKNLSTEIVDYLYRDYKLKEIGVLMGLGESFICRVMNGQRKLTLDHLVRLEQSLGQPLPKILAAVYRNYR